MNESKINDKNNDNMHRRLNSGEFPLFGFEVSEVTPAADDELLHMSAHYHCMILPVLAEPEEIEDDKRDQTIDDRCASLVNLRCHDKKDRTIHDQSADHVDLGYHESSNVQSEQETPPFCMPQYPYPPGTNPGGFWFIHHESCGSSHEIDLLCGIVDALISNVNCFDQELVYSDPVTKDLYTQDGKKMFLSGDLIPVGAAE